MKTTSDKTQQTLNALRSVAILPTMLTLGNLLCGFAAIFYASRPADGETLLNWSHVEWATWLIFLGMVFDALDGRVARMTGQTSKLGAQLDSLSDIVSFGVAPAFLLIQVIETEGIPFLGTQNFDTNYSRFVLLIALCYVACAALRLARFNVESDTPEESDHMSFKGLPSPGAAGAVVSLITLHEWFGRSTRIDAWFGSSVAEWVTDIIATFLIFLTLLVAIAMVSNLKYIHFTNRFLRGRAPFHYVVLAILIIILLLINAWITIMLSFVLYALSAPLATLLKTLRLPLPYLINPDIVFNEEQMLESDLLEKEESLELNDVDVDEDRTETAYNFLTPIKDDDDRTSAAGSSTK